MATNTKQNPPQEQPIQPIQPTQSTPPAYAAVAQGATPNYTVQYASLGKSPEAPPATTARKRAEDIQPTSPQKHRGIRTERHQRRADHRTRAKIPKFVSAREKSWQAKRRCNRHDTSASRSSTASLGLPADAKIVPRDPCPQAQEAKAEIQNAGNQGNADNQDNAETRENANIQEMD